MKPTSPTCSFPWRALLALAVFGDFSATSRADENPAASAAAAAPAAISLNFPGGTLGQLLDSLPQGSLDIVGPKDYFSAPLPAFSVQRVESRSDLIGMISVLLEPTEFRLHQVGEHLAVLTKNESKRGHEFISREISSLVDAQRSVDDIVDAIRTACAMVPSGNRDALQIKYHPQTGLLLMAGPAVDLDVAEQVLGALHSEHGRDDRLKSTAKLDSLEK